MTEQPDRHLRVVRRSPDTPIINIAPVLGDPNAFVLRRGAAPAGVVAGDAEAQIEYDPAGAWQVSYGRDADVDGWQASLTLPGRVDGGVLAWYAAELVDAFDTRVPGWHVLLGAAIRQGGIVVEIVRLHGPFAGRHSDGSPVLPAVCTGEVREASPLWHECPTVRLVSKLLGVDLDGYR